MCILFYYNSRLETIRSGLLLPICALASPLLGQLPFRAAGMVLGEAASPPAGKTLPLPPTSHSPNHTRGSRPFNFPASSVRARPPNVYRSPAARPRPPLTSGLVGAWSGADLNVGLHVSGMSKASAEKPKNDGGRKVRPSAMTASTSTQPARAGRSDPRSLLDAASLTRLRGPRRPRKTMPSPLPTKRNC